MDFLSNHVVETNPRGLLEYSKICIRDWLEEYISNDIRFYSTRIGPLRLVLGPCIAEVAPLCMKADGNQRTKKALAASHRPGIICKDNKIQGV